MSDVRVDHDVFQRLQEVLTDFFERAELQLQATATEISEHRESLSREARAASLELDELHAAGRPGALGEARGRHECAEGAVQRFEAAVEEYEAEAQLFRGLLDERTGELLRHLHERVGAYLDVRQSEGASQAPALSVGLSVGVPGLPFAGVGLAVDVPLKTPESGDTNDE